MQTRKAFISSSGSGSVKEMGAGSDEGSRGMQPSIWRVPEVDISFDP